jgi:hypothetical protein
MPSRKKKSSRKKSAYEKYLQKKIKINMHEWKKGRWTSQKQALAVSYSQARDKFSKKRKR